MRKRGRACVLFHITASMALASPADPVERQAAPYGHVPERTESPAGDRVTLVQDGPSGSVPQGSGATGAPAARRVWPCLLVVDEDLRPFAELAWDRSATFRDQCRTLGAGRATVVVRSAPSRALHAATARIELTGGGTLFARVWVRVRRGVDIVELIAHELEHVLERVEGINLLMESRRDGSTVTLLSDGAFESGRAIDAGRRVAREVRQATRRTANVR